MQLTCITRTFHEQKKQKRGEISSDLKDREVVRALGLSIILLHSKHVKAINLLAALVFSCGKILEMSLGEVSYFRSYTESVKETQV